MARPLPYSDFSAGLNTKDSPFLLDEGLGPLPARDLSNVQGTTAGAIVKRDGLLTFATPATVLSSLFPLEAVSPGLLVGAGGSTLVSISSTGVVTVIKTGLTPDLRWEFVSAPVVAGQGPLYGMNGVDTPQQWSGTGSTAPWVNASGAKPVPNGKYCISANNQVFVAGVAATPSTVYWSALLGSGGADPTNWDDASLTSAGAQPFDQGDGQPITGLGRVGPYVLVFKPRKTWVIVDTGSGTFRQLSDSVGCVAHRSIAQGREGTYFLSEDRGVYVTNGTTLTPISDKVMPTMALGEANSAAAAGVYFNAHYYLSLAISGSGTGENDAVLDYDTTLQSWWRHDFGSNQFAIFHGAAGSAMPTAAPLISLAPSVPALLSAKASDAIVDWCFVPGAVYDNGSPFRWSWLGPWQSPSFYRRRLFPTPFYRKRLRQFRIGGVGTVDFSLAKDYVPSPSLIRSDILGPTTIPGTFPGRAYSLGVANVFSVVLSATSDTPDTVTSYTLMLDDRVDGVS